MTTLVVLHDVGDAAGGAGWAAAFVTAGWTGPVLAPDLPGHAGAPPPVGGNHEPADGAFFLVGLLASARVSTNSAAPTGRSSSASATTVPTRNWPASLASPRVSSLVDGLGGPFRGPVADIDADRRRLRSIASDATAVAPMPAGAAVDPRLRHGVVPYSDLGFARRVATALPVPVLVVESPASGTSPDDVAHLVASMASGSTLVTVSGAGPTEVAAAIVAALAS